MHRDFKSYKNVTERRQILGTYATQGRLEIDLIKPYEKIPEISPWRGFHIHFYEDGIEAITDEVKENGETTLHAILIDEARKQLIMFHYNPKTMEGRHIIEDEKLLT